nr:TetR family transcriptional regulator [Sphingomonas kyeonggiensis]
MNRSIAPLGISVDAIVDKALDLIASGGLAELTLRPLAMGLGVSVPVISARMGSKEQLLEGVTKAAHRRDLAFFARWRDLANAIGPMDAAMHAAMAELALRDWVTRERRQIILLIELVHDRALRPDRFQPLEDWLDDAGQFWAEMIFGDAALADLALGYMLDESGFSLGADDNPKYALLRSLCLQRFANGMFPAGSEAAADTITPLIGLLDPAVPPAAEEEDAKRQRIVRSAADLIVSQGIESVTHRSVALAAGVPASTVVYHFGARPALVVAGLHAVIARFHKRRGDIPADRGGAPPNDTSIQDLIKATSMIALASTREPSLLPYAIDMRRRRGENWRVDDMAPMGIGTGAGFDRTAAQVLSIAAFGMGMVGMARKTAERDHYRRAFTAFEAWRIRSSG